MRSILFAFVLVFGLIACSRKPEAGGPERQYPVSGKIISLDAGHQTAMIDAAAIPGFMDAMAMDYPIQSKSEFESLHPGDRIKAIVHVNATGDSYFVSDIQKQNARK